MGKKSDCVDALIFAALLIALLYFGAKHYWEFFDKCKESGKSDDFCHNLLR